MIHRLSQKQAAELVGVTPRSLREWHAPRNADGSYPGPQLVAWLLQRQQAGDLDPVQERARKDAEHADRLAMANAVTRGKLVSTEEVVEKVGGYIDACRNRLAQLPGRAAAEFDPDTGRKLEPVLQRIVREVIAELRNYRPWNATETTDSHN